MGFRYLHGFGESAGLQKINRNHRPFARWALALRIDAVTFPP
jgi:hypothetical protein